MVVLKKSLAALAFLNIITLIGCGAYVSPDLMYKLQDDVKDLQSEVSTLKEGDAAPAGERAGDTSRGMGDAELELRKEIASVKADLEALRGEIRHFQGFIDETKYQIQQDQLGTGERIALNEKKLLELEGKVSTLMTETPGPAGIEKESAVLPMDTGRREVPGEEKQEEVLTSEGELVARGTVPLKGPEDLYDYSLGLIKASKFREARGSLQEFASTYPNHRLMPNVYYWRGETFYAEKDFESAAITFQEVIDRYPDSMKASDALYKQGLCFYNMKDSVSAKAAFNLLISKYPTSIAAGKAKSMLQKIDEKGG